jgi:hypothetical protein
VIDREGNSVRIICFDRNKIQSIIALHGADEHTLSHHSNGEYYGDGTLSLFDLFMAPVEKTGWMPIIKHKYTQKIATLDLYQNEQEAKCCYDRYASSYPDFVLICIKQITWEE